MEAALIRRAATREGVADLSEASQHDRATNTVARSASSRDSRRILLVEDNADVAESMAELLAMYGHIVSIAQDGAAALGLLPKFEPDIVLLDIGLPGMDGYQVARRIRNETAKANLIVITLSGYGGEEYRSLSREAGCDDHLVKPIQPDVLRNLLNSVSSTSSGTQLTSRRMIQTP